MIKVLFLTDNLHGGGAEKVLVNLVNLMDKSKFDITVRTCFSGGVNVDLLNGDIKYQCKKAPVFKGIKNVIKFIPASILYRYFIGKNDYDVLIAYMHGNPTKVVSGANDKKKIAWIHGNMMTGRKPTLAYFFVSKATMNKQLKKFDHIVGVSETICNSFKEYTGITENVILKHNTNDVEKILKSADEEAAFPFERTNDETVFCSVGSLVEVKGFERLIKSAEKLKKEGKAFKVIILGEGRLRATLSDQISAAGLQDTVFLLGFQNNPYKYISKCDAFICSSYSEGLSTALSEAIILGLPCVSTDVSGAKEILGNNNEYGIVVENSESGIYDGMKRLTEDKEALKKYAIASKERSSFFSPERTVKEVEELIENLLKQQGSA